MRTKIAIAVAFLSMLSVITAMIGTVAADQTNIFEKNATNRPDQIILQKGDEVNQDSVISGFMNNANTVRKESVPEFPTIALPVAAIMGLVFFFHIRKNKNIRK